MTYTYTQYFQESDYYKTSLNLGKNVVFSDEYTKFKQHIVDIGALDLTNPKIRSQIPTPYWKHAIRFNIHMFQTDLNYIKNTMYQDPVFNLLSPVIENEEYINKYVQYKIIVLHEEFYTKPDIPNNLKNILWTYLGNLYSADIQNKTLNAQRPLIQLWFDRVRQKTY